MDQPTDLSINPLFKDFPSRLSRAGRWMRADDDASLTFPVLLMCTALASDIC